MADESMDIPIELQFKDVRKQNKVIVGKQSRQVLPQNGTDFTMSSTGQTQIIFRLPNDENSSVDFNSMWIVADLQILNLDATAISATTVGRLTAGNLFGCTVATAGQTVTAAPVAICALGDSIESIVARVAVYVNGSELEREDYYNNWESFSNMHANNANFSNSIGSGAMLMNLDIVERSRQLLVGAVLPASNIIQVAFPLRYLGISNLRSLVPTYLMGGGQSSIEIRIYLSSVLDCLTVGTISAPTGTTTVEPAELWTPATTTPTIQLSNVRMNIDYVHTSEQYSSALREYLTSNALTLPLKTFYQTIYQIPASSSGWVNYTVSTQFSDVEAVFCVFFNSAEQSSLAFLGSDRCHKPSSLIQARLSINGQIYPSVPIVFNSASASLGAASQCAEAYQYLLKALFQNTSLEVIGNTNQKWVGANNQTIFTGNSLNNAGGVPNYSSLNVANFESKVGQGFYYGRDKRYSKNQTFSAPALVGGVYTVNNHNLFSEQEWFWDSPTQFGIGFDVSKSSYNDEYTLSGSDLSKTSGLIQVQLQFNGNDTNAYNCLVVVQHKRLLEIGLDNAQVIY